jgi:hypothetical protein
MNGVFIAESEPIGQCFDFLKIWLRHQRATDAGPGIRDVSLRDLSLNCRKGFPTDCVIRGVSTE